MRLSPVALVFLALSGLSLPGSDQAGQGDSPIYSMSWTSNGGRRYSLRILRSFLEGSGWHPSEIEGVALVRILEIAREKVLAMKLAEPVEVKPAGISLQQINGEGIVFVKYRFGKTESVMIAVNAAFQAISPEVK
jgi:hypothetical protein